MRKVLAIVAILGGGVALWAAFAPRAHSTSAPPTDATCGPRCVDYILNKFGKSSESLVELVRKMQVGTGRLCSLADIEEALTSRGVYCQELRLGPWSCFRWDGPAVLHVNGNHFCVAESADEDGVRVWWGDGSVETWTWGALRPRLSSVVLVASDVAIETSACTFANNTLICEALAGVALILTGVSLLRKPYCAH